MTKSAGPRSNDAVLDSLHRIAGEPVAAIESRLPGLEARLRSAIAADDDRAAPMLLWVADDDRRQVTRTRRLVLLASAACVVALISVAVLARTSPNDNVVLASADSVSVVLPDGGVVAGADGLIVPEGALLDVEGFVVIDGRRFGPGLYRITGDGRVVEVGTDAGSPGPVGEDGGVIPGENDDAVTVRTTTTTEPGPSTTISGAPNESRPRPTVRPATTLPDDVPATAPPATRPPSTVTRTTVTRTTVTRRTEVTTEPLRPAATSPAPDPAETTTSTSTSTTIAQRGAVPVDRSGGRSD